MLVELKRVWNQQLYTAKTNWLF